MCTKFGIYLRKILKRLKAHTTLFLSTVALKSDSRSWLRGSSGMTHGDTGQWKRWTTCKKFKIL